QAKKSCLPTSKRQMPIPRPSWNYLRRYIKLQYLVRETKKNRQTMSAEEINYTVWRLLIDMTVAVVVAMSAVMIVNLVCFGEHRLFEGPVSYLLAVILGLILYILAALSGLKLNMMDKFYIHGFSWILISFIHLSWILICRWANA